MVDIVTLGRGVLVVLRFVVFGLTLIGFAFVSMGVATSSIITQLGADATEIVRLFFRMAETIPFIVGFSMLYLSLYR